MTNYAKDHVPDWSRKPDPARINQLISWVERATQPITVKNFRRWIVEVAYENDDAAACSNGHDHACNRGLGEWMGIEPYGQGKDGSVPWDKQVGYSAERLNRFVDPRWQVAVIAAPIGVQRQAYVTLLETLRDKGEFEYKLPLNGLPDFSDVAELEATG